MFLNLDSQYFVGIEISIHVELLSLTSMFTILMPCFLTSMMMYTILGLHFLILSSVF